MFNPSASPSSIQITPVEQALRKTIREVDQLLARHPPDDDEIRGTNELLARDFQSCAPELVQAVARAREHLQLKQAQIVAFESQNWLMRRLRRRTLAALHLARDQGEYSLSQATAHLEFQERHHRDDPDTLIRVRLRSIELAAGKSIRSGLERVREAAQSLEARIHLWKSHYGSLNAVLQSRLQLPELANIGSIEAVLTALDSLQAKLADRIRRYGDSADALAQAQLVLDDLLAHGEQAYDAAPATFRQRTEGELRRFATFDSAGLSLSSLLEEMASPLAFRLPAAWLAFWTAAAACERSAPPSGGPAVSESVRAGLWCNAWRHQMRCWPADDLEAIGLGKDALSTLVFQLEDGGAKAKTGADVLVIYDVGAFGRHYCGVACIQFKQLDDSNLAIAFSQSFLRQSDNILRLHRASGGRWPGIYALLRPLSAGLASVPAVTIDSVISQFSPVFMLDGSKAVRALSAISWAEHGQSLPTALARCLTEHSAQPFSSLSEAFDWLDRAVDIELPGYLIVQSVGEHSYSLGGELERVRCLAQTRGHQYKLLDEPNV